MKDPHEMTVEELIEEVTERRLFDEMQEPILEALGEEMERLQNLEAGIVTIHGGNHGSGR